MLAPLLPSRGARAALRNLRKYIQPLPVPGNGIVIATPTVTSAVTNYELAQVTLTRQLHPDLPPTDFWGYDDGTGVLGQAGSFGMIVVAQSGTPVAIDFENDLPRTYPSWIPIDTRLVTSGDEIRLMTHLHGGFVAADSDGNPAITPAGFAQGEKQHVFYPNDATHQPASLLWFHDHGLGATRLNVFAGLAAGYLIRDSADTGTEDNANGLPAGPYEIPLVVQDRRFAPDGSLFYPRSEIDGVTWIGEYFGDVMLVNGKVWPYLDVEPRLYRFRVLNGCNARFLSLAIGGTPMWQIGAEGGMWTHPVPVRRVVLAPAERADLLVDFSRLAGRTTQLKNGPLPPHVSSPAPMLPQVMEIHVANMASQAPTIPQLLVGGRDAIVDPPAQTRFITLNEVGVDAPDWRLTLNAKGFGDPVTETPHRGSTEEWLYTNLTGDTHPMHMHLVTFQVVGRVPFDVDAYIDAAGMTSAGAPAIDPQPFATGPMLPADPTEVGFKDTVKADPGMFTIVRAKFDLPAGLSTPQRYVYHCHIVEHEDNDMMRPYEVI